MHKLIMRGIAILIGLSAFTGCISDLFNMDEPNSYITENYNNESDFNIILVFENNNRIDSIKIESNSVQNRFVFVKDDGDDPIGDGVNFLVQEQLSVKLINESDKSLIIQSWTSPAGHFGDSINSPFNYDSWGFEALKPDDRNVVGKITFTITNDDLN